MTYTEALARAERAERERDSNRQGLTAARDRIASLEAKLLTDMEEHLRVSELWAAEREDLRTQVSAAQGTWQLAQAMLTAANARLLDVEAQLAAVTAERSALQRKLNEPADLGAMVGQQILAANDTLRAQLGALAGQVGELRASLEAMPDFSHDDGCDFWHRGTCDCGVYEYHALKRAALTTPAGQVGAAAMAWAALRDAELTMDETGNACTAEYWETVEAERGAWDAYRRAKGEVSQ